MSTGSLNTMRAVAVAALLAAGVLAPSASAAAPVASATTGNATSITDSSAVLTGIVKPDGVPATYYFQYGLTAKYTTVTPVVPAGSGTGSAPVAVGVANLSADTKYHFRIVVFGAGGTKVGSDKTFTTAPAPLAFQLSATPNPISYMGSTTISGVLSGTGAGNRAVVLQENPFPYAAFVSIENAELTNSNGSFSFPVGPLTQNTQFRILVDGTTIASPAFTEEVAVGVSATARVQRTRSGVAFRVSGTVTPASTAIEIWLQKLVGPGKWMSTVRILPVVQSPTTLTYTRFVKVHKGGSYRIYAQVLDGSHLSSVSQVLTIRRPR